jgi:uncharacterized protein YbdZ (MbtH family)
LQRGDELLSIEPFDDDRGSLSILVNDKEQRTLWSAFADVQVGWRVLDGEFTCFSCESYIEQTWPDIRALSLRERLGTAPAFR